MTRSVVGSRSSKAFPKAKRASRKRSWSLFGGLLPIWSITAFWILVKSLHLRSMLSKSMRCIENYSQLYSTERAQFLSVTPNSILHNQCFKSWTNWAVKFCFICHIYLTSHQLTTTSSSILTTFHRENVSTTSRMQKMLSKYSSNVKAHLYIYIYMTYLFIFLFFIFLFMLFFFFGSGFCHTLKWNSHGFTCGPHPDPPSHLPLHPLPLGLPSAPGPSACLMHPTWAGDLLHLR